MLKYMVLVENFFLFSTSIIILSIFVLIILYYISDVPFYSKFCWPFLHDGLEFYQILFSESPEIAILLASINVMNYINWFLDVNTMEILFLSAGLAKL